MILGVVELRIACEFNLIGIKELTLSAATKEFNYYLGQTIQSHQTYMLVEPSTAVQYRNCDLKLGNSSCL